MKADSPYRAIFPPPPPPTCHRCGVALANRPPATGASAEAHLCRRCQLGRFDPFSTAAVAVLCGGLYLGSGALLLAGFAILAVNAVSVDREE
jgi:hypothetical protein